MALANHLAKRLDDEAAELESGTRSRIEAMARSLRRRAETIVGGWRAMLIAARGAAAGVRRLAPVERFDGREIDVGFHRHWVDPTVPFIEAVARPAHGVVVTSATLTDISERPPLPKRPETRAKTTGEAPLDPIEAGWRAAETRSGRAICRSGCAPASPRPSTIRPARASSSSTISGATIWRRSRRPIARCSWPPAAAGSACSRRSPASRRA